MSVVVYGSIVLDMVSVSKRLPSLNETIVTDDVIICPGGKGANQALAASRLGSEVRLVSHVGDDFFASKAMSNVIKDVNVDKVKTSKRGTAIGLLQSSISGDNQIVVASRALADAKSSDVSNELLLNSDVFLTQSELPFKEVSDVIRRASKHGCCVVLNLAPVVQFDTSLLRSCDYLILNQTEARQFLEKPLSSISEFALAAETIFQTCCVNVIITLGPTGAVSCFDGIPFMIPTQPVKATDPAGSGDAFCGTFAAAIDEGRSALEAVRLASASGALTCLGVGPQTTLPYRDKTLSKAAEIDPPFPLA